MVTGFLFCRMRTRRIPSDAERDCKKEKIIMIMSVRGSKINLSACMFSSRISSRLPPFQWWCSPYTQSFLFALLYHEQCYPM